MVASGLPNPASPPYPPAPVFHPPYSPNPPAQVLLAPGDTFRAAAAEQLAAWAKRCGAKMGTFKEGGRPGGVLAAACNDAKQQKDVDVVICDTGMYTVC